MRRTTLTVLVTATLTLAACSGGDDPDPSGVEVDDPTLEPDDDPTDAPDGPTTDDGAADGGAGDDGDPAGADTTDDADPDQQQAAPLEVAASTDDRDRANDGMGLTVTDVRVGTHDGFDRVVVELTGDAETGWYTAYAAEAQQAGSGEVVPLAGDAALTLAVRGVLLPPDRDADAQDTAWDGEPPAVPRAAQVLTEVVDGIVYEGQHQVFLGVEREVPYRIARLTDPQRIVVDLVHTS